ncbi:MAG: hypothetical protein AB7Q17_11875 [Phycisphaerae bacterium]
MHARRRLLSFVGLVVVGALPLWGAPFTWNGSVDLLWTRCANWSHSGFPATCYPSSSADDVTIPYVGSPGATDWVIAFPNVTVDDVVIYESTKFESSGGSNLCLTVDSLTIDATDHTSDLEVDFDEAIVTNNCPT